jgi:hypothetical protein
MNKKIIIIVGIVLVVLVIGVWVYLLLSGRTSESRDTYADLQTGGEGAPPSFEDTSGTDPVPQKQPQLHQLTLRPVAGAVLTDLGMVFVEQGTGHIFNINLTTGVETILSGTTLEGARSAVFSDQGKYVAITHEQGGLEKSVVGSITADGILEGVALPEGATEVEFDEEGDKLYYLFPHETGSRGYAYDIDSSKTTELFDITPRDVRVIWGDTVYVYTTPSSEVEGYVYEIKNNSLEYVSMGEKGLVALMSPAGLVLTVNSFSGVSSYLLADESIVYEALIPEKCVSSEKGFVCAIPFSLSGESFPDDWYKGLAWYSDRIWELNVESGDATLVVDLNTSGQPIDVSYINISDSENVVYFTNKNDNTLWLFNENP